MRNIQRIPIVLNKIDWRLFIKDNVDNLNESQLNLLTNKIINNIEDIKNKWLKSPNYNLGQLLIIENYLPENNNLLKLNETEWLITNNLCKFEEINFWNRMRDKKGNRLPEVQMILLKDLESSHISAILDYCLEMNINLNKDYKKYFESVINNLKV